ncbi:hypothetical protein GCM10029964_126710 [Kibdelosporangium lantanae]
MDHQDEGEQQADPPDHRGDDVQDLPADLTGGAPGPLVRFGVLGHTGKSRMAQAAALPNGNYAMIRAMIEPTTSQNTAARP